MFTCRLTALPNASVSDRAQCSVAQQKCPNWTYGRSYGLVNVLFQQGHETFYPFTRHMNLSFFAIVTYNGREICGVFFQESWASSARARSSNSVSFVRTFDWNKGAFVGGRMLEVLRCYPHRYDLLHSDCEDTHQTQNACRREWWLALVENMAICLNYIDTFFRCSWTTNCMTQFQRCAVRADGASPKLNKAFIFMILQWICAPWTQLNCYFSNL